MPLLLAIVHTVVGIKFSSTMVQMFGSGTSILTMSLVTAGIMLVVYGGYFLATYWGCKSMIRPKKINIAYETLSIYQIKISSV